MKNYSQNEKQRYLNIIQYKFNDIYFQKNHEIHSDTSKSDTLSISEVRPLKSSYVTQTHRQQIFQTQYPMEKRGKTFGSSEMRMIKIIRQTQQFIQIDKNRQGKKLPDPTNFSIQTYDLFENDENLNQTQWSPKLSIYKFRIKLTYDNRGQIFIYFERQSNCMQISAFLKCLVQKSQGNSISFLYCPKKYNEKLVQKFSQKILIFSKQVQKRKQMKHKLKALTIIQNELKDSFFVTDLIQSWRQKVLQLSNEKLKLKNDSILKIKLKLEKIISRNELNIKETRFLLNINKQQQYFSELVQRNSRQKQQQQQQHGKAQNSFEYQFKGSSTKQFYFQSLQQKLNFILVKKKQDKYEIQTQSQIVLGNLSYLLKNKLGYAQEAQNKEEQVVFDQKNSKQQFQKDKNINKQTNQFIQKEKGDSKQKQINDWNSFQMRNKFAQSILIAENDYLQKISQLSQENKKSNIQSNQQSLVQEQVVVNDLQNNIKQVPVTIIDLAYEQSRQSLSNPPPQSRETIINSLNELVKQQDEAESRHKFKIQKQNKQEKLVKLQQNTSKYASNGNKISYNGRIIIRMNNNFDKDAALSNSDENGSQNKQDNQNNNNEQKQKKNKSSQQICLLKLKTAQQCYLIVKVQYQIHFPLQSQQYSSPFKNEFSQRQPSLPQSKGNQQKNIHLHQNQFTKQFTPQSIFYNQTLFGPCYYIQSIQHHYLTFIKNHYYTNKFSNNIKTNDKINGNINSITQNEEIISNGNGQIKRQDEKFRQIKDYQQYYRIYIEQQRPIQANVNISRLIKALKVQQLVKKFFLSQQISLLYNQCNKYSNQNELNGQRKDSNSSGKCNENDKKKGTFVYKYLLNRSKDVKYYDVQRLQLEYQNSNSTSIKRILHALKAFDQSVRIIFTSSLYQLARRVFNIISIHSFELQSCSFSSSNKIKANLNLLDNIFQTTILGNQSCAFFIILSLIRHFSSIFLMNSKQPQNQKYKLHWNSLLLKLVLSSQFSEIAKKSQRIEINIETLFGINFISLMSQYYSDYVWVQLICKQIEFNHQKSSNDQYKNQTQGLQKEGNYRNNRIDQSIRPQNKSNPQGQISAPRHIYPSQKQIYPYPGYIYHYLISSFIVLLQKIIKLSLSEKATDSCSIRTGQQLIIQLKEKSKLIAVENVYGFFQQIDKTNEIVKLYSESQNYNQVAKELQEIYQAKKSKGSNLNKQVEEQRLHVPEQKQKANFGSLAYAVYQQFVLHNTKSSTGQYQQTVTNSNENSPNSSSFSTLNQRKMFIFIDKLVLQNQFSLRKLLVQIYQSKQLLYSHEFKNVDIDLFTLNVQLVTPKTNQNLVIYLKSKQKNYFYVLDLQKTSSNIYHHYVKPLIYSIKSPCINQNNYIMFQLFIKDNNLVEHFLNTIPNKYYQKIINPNQKVKQQVIKCAKYLQNYRMTQTNFNLLYMQLGWYGNHYLIPNDRLLNLHFFNRQSFSSSQLQAPQPQNINPDQSQLYSILSISRFIFGKGLIPRFKSLNQNCVYDVVKNNIRFLNNSFLQQSEDDQIAKQHNSAQNLFAYALQNFNMDEIDSFFLFFVKMSQLPLIDYLTYNPMTQFILPSIQYHGSYVNNIQGFKLNFTVFLCDSPEQRKEGQRWEKLIVNFSQNDMNLVQLQLTQIENIFCTEEHQHEQSQLRFTQYGKQKNHKILKFSSSDSRLKQYYQLFPRTFNFSHLLSNFSVDHFSLVLKFNIFFCVIKKYYKIHKRQNLQFKHLIQTLNQRQAKNIGNQKYHYRLKLIQDQRVIPNLKYSYLFKYMIQTSLQHHVSIQIKKQRIMNFQTMYSSASFLIKSKTQKHTLFSNREVQIFERLKLKNRDKIKLYKDLAIIRGKIYSVEVLQKDSLRQNHNWYELLASSINEKSHFQSNSQNHNVSVNADEDSRENAMKKYISPIAQLDKSAMNISKSYTHSASSQKQPQLRQINQNEKSQDIYLMNKQQISKRQFQINNQCKNSATYYIVQEKYFRMLYRVSQNDLIFNNKTISFYETN